MGIWGELPEILVWAEVGWRDGGKRRDGLCRISGHSAIDTDTKKPRSCDLGLDVNGGMDGIRTRDPLRDRQVF